MQVSAYCLKTNDVVKLFYIGYILTYFIFTSTCHGNLIHLHIRAHLIYQKPIDNYHISSSDWEIGHLNQNQISKLFLKKTIIQIDLIRKMCLCYARFYIYFILNQHDQYFGLYKVSSIIQRLYLSLVYSQFCIIPKCTVRPCICRCAEHSSKLVQPINIASHRCAMRCVSFICLNFA